MSAHSLRVSVSHFRRLKWETPTFTSLSLWLKHPDLNPVNYKICIEIQQRVCLRNIHKVGGHIYGIAGMALSNASSICYRIGVNVSKCVFM